MVTVKIELTGDVKSYIDMASGLVFESGKAYSLSEENAKKFLSQRTDGGEPYFRRFREAPKVEEDTPEVFEKTPTPVVPEGVVTLPDTMKKGAVKMTFGKKARKEDPKPEVENQVPPPDAAEGDSSEDTGGSVTI